MTCLADCLQQCAVTGKAVSIAPLALTGFEHRLKIVEHKEAAPIPQKQQQGR